MADISAKLRAKMEKLKSRIIDTSTVIEMYNRTKEKAEQQEKTIHALLADIAAADERTTLVNAELDTFKSSHLQSQAKSQLSHTLLTCGRRSCPVHADWQYHGVDAQDMATKRSTSPSD